MRVARWWPASSGPQAQEHIGSTALARNDVTRESAGASAPLVTGDSVFRNETVRTGADSNARLVFLDSTNLGVGPTSSVKLDQFVYVGESNGQKMTVNLAKGVFRFTTGVLDKKAYEITTPTAAIGVRGTVLDIAVQGPDTRVTLVEGQALVCPRRPGVSFAQQERNCAKAAGGVGGSALRLRRPEERRPDRAGQENRERECDLERGELRVQRRRLRLRGALRTVTSVR